jgi:site-specific DNA-methyltransferase (cytosine-N4-specific)
MGETVEVLHSVDWDFACAPSNGGIHSIHPYPAKFIPEIPRQLIRLFHPNDQSVLLDPFCGSGTTLVEGIKSGIDSWGIDVNPLACLISEVKTVPLYEDIEIIADRIVHRSREFISKNEVDIPIIPHIDHWFKPEIQKVLSVLVKEINREKTCGVVKALKVALSSIVVRVSNQESDTRYAAIEKVVSTEDVFEQFHQSVSSIWKAVNTLSDSLFHRLGRAVILNRDMLAVSPDELPRNVGLVITSPPYPNAYEYWLYHKY